MKYFVRPSIRMQSAVLTGMGGGATAQAMGLWGGDLARFLPPTMAFDLGGCFWCRLCGRCAGQCAGTQRPAWYGNVYPCMASRHFAGRVHRRFAVWAIGFRCALRRGRAVGSAMTEAAPLGLLAVSDGVMSSWFVAAVWVLSAALVHVILRAERQVSI